jgi:hypothetical protein
MSRDSQIYPSTPPELQNIAANIKWTGIIGFWFQLSVGIVSVFALAVSIAQGSVAQASRTNSSTSTGIFFAIGGLLALGASTYFFFRYTRMARLFFNPPAQRPKKTDTLRVIGVGRTITIVGTLLSIFGTQIVVGTVLLKALTQTGNLAGGQGGCAVAAADVFAIQANTAILTANFFGLAITLWLLNRLTHLHK